MLNPYIWAYRTIVCISTFVESRFVVVDVGGINIYIFLAGGQVVSSRDPVSRDPLSAQVGDRRVAAFRAFIVICMTRCWIFGPCS